MSRHAPVTAARRMRRNHSGTRWPRGTTFHGALLVCLLLSGCNRADMADGAKLRDLAPSSFFPDGSSARERIPDTVAWGHLKGEDLLYKGKDHGEWARRFPFPITQGVLERGRERYNIHCAVCHDRSGAGLGMIVRRGFRPPPTFHQDRLRTAPIGHFFDVITNGFGAMYAQGDRLSPEDRWAIVAYIRALQLSQHAALADVPASQRRDMEKEH